MIYISPILSIFYQLVKFLLFFLITTVDPVFLLFFLITTVDPIYLLFFLITTVDPVYFLSTEINIWKIYLMFLMIWETDFPFSTLHS